MHTIRTQFAHTQHTEQNIEQNIEQNTRYNNNMQHIEDNTENNTEQHTENSTQPQRTENSTYDLHTYSLDLYHEQIYIKNSNTIEIYTILK